MAHQDRVNIAVFIDFDNIEIGVRTTLNEHFDVGTILEALKERGEVVTKIAYADWTRAGEYSRALTQHAIRLVQRNLTPGGDKNGADINLALDALEMAFTHPHINAYVIVGGDSDFLSLVEKLKQYDKKVFVIPDILANAGGVTTSYFEWVQDRQGYFWKESVVNEQLEHIMKTAFEDVVRYSETHGVNNRIAAYMLAIDRVGYTIRQRGIYA